MYLISLLSCRIRNKVLPILISNKYSTFDSVYYKNLIEMENTEKIWDQNVI